MFILALLIKKEQRAKEYSSDRLQLDIHLQKKRHEKTQTQSVSASNKLRNNLLWDASTEDGCTNEVKIKLK